MVDDPLIQARNVSFGFMPISAGDRKLLNNPLALVTNFYKVGSKRSYVNALTDISFDLYSGDKLGILGVNGAGKSTLIRLLAGIYPVISGDLTIRGQTTGLFDVSSGTNQAATGLENIYLRGLQMGMTMKQIKSKIPEVLEFTQLGDDINKSFETYSSGMRLRLAFAVSTMIDPDILLMDEWLGAGDVRFQSKVKERMETLLNRSNALVITSHNKGLLKSLCNKGLVLDNGRQVFNGSLKDAIDYYENCILKKN